jgi:hypothetical protein
MTLTSRTSLPLLLRQTAMAAATTAVCASTSAALPLFTLDPGAAGLEGASFTGDNILISDYSVVKSDGVGGFTDTGYLSVSAIQLGGSTFTPVGLGSDYGLYFAFTAVGTTSTDNALLVPTVGNLTSLTYTLYGYNGTANFGFSGNTPTETAVGEVALASGNLLTGNVVSIPTGDGLTFTPSAAANVTFATAVSEDAFFVSPAPFHNLAFAAFTNTTTQVEAFEGGFRIRQGGGAVNFASAVPEPETYAMLLGGLAAIVFVAKRRRPT